MIFIARNWLTQLQGLAWQVWNLQSRLSRRAGRSYRCYPWLELLLSFFSLSSFLSLSCSSLSLSLSSSFSFLFILNPFNWLKQAHPDDLDNLPHSCQFWASLVPQRVKRLPAVQETWVWSLGREDPLEKEMATHSSILAWRSPWTEEPGRLQSKGSQRVGQDFTFTSLMSVLEFNHIFKKKKKPRLVFDWITGTIS